MPVSLTQCSTSVERVTPVKVQLMSLTMENGRSKISVNAGPLLTMFSIQIVNAVLGID